MTKRLILHIFAAISLLVAYMIVLLCGGVGGVYAAENKYSNVLDDLRKDETFDFNEYPNVDGDYSLQVIQIAESTDGELFLYVYQPAAHIKQLTATTVNMSLSESVDGTALFNLTLLNREGVLQKYRVDGVKVSSDEVRYYNITSISRDYDGDIDTGSTPDSVITKVAYSVGKVYKAEMIDGKVDYLCEEITTITITDLFFDYLDYPYGFALFTGDCYGHYVAFSTDMPIENLCNADVFYNSETITEDYAFGVKTSSKSSGIVPHNVTLSNVDTATVSGKFSSKVYSWKRIQSVDDFIKTEDLKDNTKANLDGKQWVLRYAETEYSKVGDYKVNQRIFTNVTDVTILRLEFKTAGKLYNLGAVSASGHSDNYAGNNSAPVFNFWEWLANLLGVPEWAAQLIVYGIVVVLILSPILMLLSSIFPVVGTVLKKIFEGLGLIIKYFFMGLWYVVKYLALGIYYVVSLPFRGIIALVRKIRGD